MVLSEEPQKQTQREDGRESSVTPGSVVARNIKETVKDSNY